jgi:hypothetical protein
MCGSMRGCASHCGRLWAPHHKSTQSGDRGQLCQQLPPKLLQDCPSREGLQALLHLMRVAPQVLPCLYILKKQRGRTYATQSQFAPCRPVPPEQLRVVIVALFCCFSRLDEVHGMHAGKVDDAGVVLQMPTSPASRAACWRSVASTVDGSLEEHGKPHLNEPLASSVICCLLFSLSREEWVLRTECK